MRALILISRATQERRFKNFCTQPLPIFIILRNYATGAILNDFETATFLECTRAYPNFPILPGALLLKFCAEPLPIFVIWLNYATRAISRDS